MMAYLLSALGWWGAIYQSAFAGWMTPLFGPYLPSLAFALAFVALWWGIVRSMDRRRSDRLRGGDRPEAVIQ